MARMKAILVAVDGSGTSDRAVRHAEQIIAVSESTKHDLVRMLGAPAEKITVIYEAADPMYRPMDREQALRHVRSAFDLPDEFILFVSTIEPRRSGRSSRVATMSNVCELALSSAEPPLISADPHQIQQVVLNLLINAAEAVGDGGTVAARTGVTTWLDVGSAGSYSWPGFRRFIAEPGRVRIFALLNLSSIGLIAPTWEFANLDYCDLDLAETIQFRFERVVSFLGDWCRHTPNSSSRMLKKAQRLTIGGGTLAGNESSTLS